MIGMQYKDLQETRHTKYTPCRLPLALRHVRTRHIGRQRNIKKLQKYSDTIKYLIHMIWIKASMLDVCCYGDKTSDTNERKGFNSLQLHS